MLKTRSFFHIVLWALILSFSPSMEVKAETDAVDPVALEILQGMTTYLGGLQHFSFHTKNSRDYVLETGEIIQRQQAVEVIVQRPARFRANVNGDLVNQELYFDGSTVTLFGKRVNYYARMEAPPTLEGAIDHAMASFNLAFPLSDLIRHDSYTLLTNKIQSGYYVGTSVIHGFECDHVFFRGDEVDVQLWIENGGKPLPRKLVITTTALSDSPRFEALLTRWDVAPTLDEALFSFIPPKDAAKIEFRPVE